MSHQKDDRRLTVLIASENAIFRECLQYRLEEEVRYRVLSAGSAPEIFGQFQSSPPDILLFDMDALGPLPETLLTRLRQDWPETRVLVLSEQEGDMGAARILRAGATGLLSKKEGVKNLLRALSAVGRGETWAGRLVTARALTDLLTGTEKRGRSGDLTPRESQLLSLVRDGYRNKEIARLLRIEEPTVKAHLHSLFKKLKVRTRVEAALQAAGRG